MEIDFQIYLFVVFIVGVFVGIILTNFILKLKSKEKIKLEGLLDELKTNLKEYYKQNLLSSAEIKNVLDATNKLNKNLTTNQNLKGIFGENCLENILNTCFMNKNIDFIKQFNSKNEDFEATKPDYLINLPNEKALIIDSKLNLEKFIDFQNAQTETKQEKKKKLIQDLNSTVNSLSNKKYETILNINQPDFVLMYIPLEALINLIYTDEDFMSVVKNANEKNIIIVGSSSIITTIRLVNLIWAKEKQEKNIERIIQISKNIYKYFALHSKKLSEIRNLINSAQETMEKEFEKISKENKLFKEIEELNCFGDEIINSKFSKNSKRAPQTKIPEEFLN